MQGGIEACLCVVTKKGRMEKKQAIEYVGSMRKGIGIKLSLPKKTQEYVKTKIGGIFCHFYTTMMSIKCKQCTRIEQ